MRRGATNECLTRHARRIEAGRQIRLLTGRLLALVAEMDPQFVAEPDESPLRVAIVGQQPLATLDQVARGDGKVVLLHDGGGDRSQTIEALPRIIEGLRDEGYRFAGVSGLLGLRSGDVMPPVEGEERLGPLELATEEVMLGLRTTAGIDLGEMGARFGIDLVEINRELIANLAHEGLVELARSGHTIVPTLRGLAVADALARSFDIPS